jgi:2,3-bisphosphoglycerate-independent phosphoglycerate mutase
MKRPLALIILSGWGYSPSREGNAIALANTPNYDLLSTNYPFTLLAASGEEIGLPKDEAGDSEIGHLTIGSGRILRNNLSKIDNAINSDDFSSNKILLETMRKAKKTNLHLIGLLSDGDVHSSQNHLFALIRLAKKCGVKNVFIHATLDGRDVMANSAEIYVEALEIKMNEIGLGKLATLCGRKWTMDKSNRLERTARAYTMLVHAEGEQAFDAVNSIRGNYLRNISDEEIEPIVLFSNPKIPVATIKDDDVVFFFNHRGDRMKQLVQAVAFANSEGISATNKPKVHTVCLTEYDADFNLPAAFSKHEELKNTLAEVFAEKGILNCRITETEKYPHVTHIFNGGEEKEYACEQLVLLPSEKTDDPQPEMSSYKITDKLLRGLEAGENDVFIVNFPAVEILARTESLEKTIEAVQHIDTCLGGIADKIREIGGVLLITSDHGNSEKMIDETQNISSSNTNNPVPFHLIDENNKTVKLRENGTLADISPTIMAVLSITKPKEMTGSDLRMEN